MKIAITGGIGCGKSTALEILEKLDVHVLDSDAVVRELLNQDQAAISDITSKFGENLLVDGKIDREKLGDIVFNDPHALEWLENLLHPRVIKAWELAVAGKPNDLWAVEVPLLFEKKLETHFDYAICLSSSEELQLKRLALKGVSQSEAKKRTACQLPLLTKEQRADFVIHNNGTIEELQETISNLVNQLKNL